MMQGLPLLSLAIWAPIIAGVAVLLTGGDRNAQAARVIALIGALIGFAVTIPLYTGFNLQQGGFQFVEMRTRRDATLDMPVLILPAVQINIRAGEMPPKEDNGIAYAKIPLNAL